MHTTFTLAESFPRKGKRELMKTPIWINLVELEERIAPNVIGNPGNNNPGGRRGSYHLRRHFILRKEPV
jgi:hypothetical protein